MGMSIPNAVFELAAMVREAAPSHMGGRRAIPAWVGFGATLLVGGAILAGGRRRPVRIPSGAES
jgi:hypothetical protein